MIVVVWDTRDHTRANDKLFNYSCFASKFNRVIILIAFNYSLINWINFSIIKLYLWAELRDDDEDDA